MFQIHVRHGTSDAALEPLDDSLPFIGEPIGGDNWIFHDFLTNYTLELIWNLCLMLALFFRVGFVMLFDLGFGFLLEFPRISVLGEAAAV